MTVKELAALGLASLIAIALGCQAHNSTPHAGTVLAKVDLHEELKKIEKELERNPGSGFWHNQAAVVQLALGRAGDAEQSILHAIQLEPNAASNYYTAFAIYRQISRLEDAELMLQRGVNLDRENPVTRVSLAELYERLGKLDLARSEYLKARDLLRSAKAKGPVFVNQEGMHFDLSRTESQIAVGLRRLPSEAK